MRIITSHPAPLLAVLAASLLAPSAAVAQLFGGDAFSAEGANCYELKLKTATGVVSMKHTYHFVGSCWDGNRSFPAEAYVSWDRQSYTLSEDFRIIGTYVNPDGKSYSGKVWSQFKCNDDPEVIAAAACNGVTHDNQTGAKFLFTPYVKLRRPHYQGPDNAGRGQGVLAARGRGPRSCERASAGSLRGGGDPMKKLGAHGKSGVEPWFWDQQYWASGGGLSPWTSRPAADRRDTNHRPS